MLYLWLITLIFYRCIFLPMSASELTPAYWIDMGAMSIATLAGASLLQQSDSLPRLPVALRAGELECGISARNVLGRDA